MLQPGGVIAMADFIVKNPPRNPMEKLVAEAARKLWQVPRANVYSGEVYGERCKRRVSRKWRFEEIGASVIPGYYFEQMRPETIRAISKIRGYALAGLACCSTLRSIAASRWDCWSTYWCAACGSKRTVICVSGSGIVESSGRIAN